MVTTAYSLKTCIGSDSGPFGAYAKSKPILGTDERDVSKGIQIRHQSISTMNAFKDKSFEEFRHQYYMYYRKRGLNN